MSISIYEFIQNNYVSVLFGGLGGILASWINSKILNKRGVFRYFVTHNRIGLSTEDSVFGRVEVTWNGVTSRHLFFSTIQLSNDSLNDYENVIINCYTDNTMLLTESTHIIDSPNVLYQTDSYKKKIYVNNGDTPTENMKNIYHGQREYLIPVFNRGQKIKIEYLNTPKSDMEPLIWLSATIKGVKVIYELPQEKILGTPRNKAAIYGALVGLFGLIPLTIFVNQSWLIGLIALFYGYFVVIPGAYLIKVYRFFINSIAG